MSQDFALLYSQLGLQPGCSLEDLKRAYRVRVGELHPDRHGDNDASSEAHLAELTELTALYSGAVRFHRIHGRLPGEAPKVVVVHITPPAQPGHATRPTSGDAAAVTAGQHGASTGSHGATDRGLHDWASHDRGRSDRNASNRSSSRSTPDRNTPNRSTPTIATATILVLIIVMVALHWSETQVAQKTEEGLHAEETYASADPEEPRLVLGMEEGDVLAIQGTPERTQDGIWSYGSSWVRFEEGHLVDWSSVPPNRLRTQTPRPLDEEEEAHAQ